MKIATPQLIVYNSRIFDTQRLSQRNETAIAVIDNKISVMGSDHDIQSLTNKETIQIDAQQRWLLPALMDSHTHLSAYASRKLDLDFSDCASLDAAVNKIKIRVGETKPGNWITGGGWDKTRWGMDDFPDKKILNQISAQHFIALQSKDWHSLWINSPVLDLCHIHAATVNPDGGWILRYPNSREPNGILQEKACEPVFQAIPLPSLEALYPALKETFQEFYQFGITGVHSVETVYDFSHYQQLYDRGDLGLRIFWYFPVKHLRDSEEKGYLPGLGNQFLKICGVKMFSDGALGSQTADMLAPYQGLNHTGVPVMDDETLAEKIGLCVQKKFACAIHAIGDRANQRVLNAYAKVAAESRSHNLRHRIEHAQLLHPQDIARFAEYGIIASAQPIHLAADVPLIDQYWGERGRYAYAFESLHKSGAMLAFGSDTPIESFDPWKGIYTAVERKHLCDPKKQAYYPQEKMSIAHALQAYTANSAYTVHEEASLGTLEPGKLADFTLINQDIFNDSPEVLLETRSDLTVQNGKIVLRNI